MACFLWFKTIFSNLGVAGTRSQIRSPKESLASMNMVPGFVKFTSRRMENPWGTSPRNGLSWRKQWDPWSIPSGKRLQKTMERSTMLLLGKSTNQISIFNSVLYVYQRVSMGCFQPAMVTIFRISFVSRADSDRTFQKMPRRESAFLQHPWQIHSIISIISIIHLNISQYTIYRLYTVRSVFAKGRGFFNPHWLRWFSVGISQRPSESRTAFWVLNQGQSEQWDISLPLSMYIYV